MRLAAFTYEGVSRIGVVVGDAIRDLSQVAPGLPADMTEFLELGEPALEIARSSATRADVLLPLAEVHLQAPVARPRKFLGIGANYPGKAMPMVDGRRLNGQETERHQHWFNKQVTCVNGPFDPIRLPATAAEVCHEGELAFVIGKRCRHVAAERAAEVIAGYLICNDVTVVDWLRRSPTATLGKSFDTHGPIGPWIVTADELGDPHALALRSCVNGEERQRANTAEMHFNCFEMVAYLSAVFTLEPGDILTTGSPSCVKQPLRAGDVVRCEIDGIGHIENTVVAET